MAALLIGSSRKSTCQSFSFFRTGSHMPSRLEHNQGGREGARKGWSTWVWRKTKGDIENGCTGFAEVWEPQNTQYRDSCHFQNELFIGRESIVSLTEGYCGFFSGLSKRRLLIFVLWSGARSDVEEDIEMVWGMESSLRLAHRRRLSGLFGPHTP